MQMLSPIAIGSTDDESFYLDTLQVSSCRSDMTSIDDFLANYKHEPESIKEFLLSLESCSSTSIKPSYTSDDISLNAVSNAAPPPGRSSSGLAVSKSAAVSNTPVMELTDPSKHSLSFSEMSPEEREQQRRVRNREYQRRFRERRKLLRLGVSAHRGFPRNR
jgi:hypothetical protein